jgi:hypothetical protein
MRPLGERVWEKVDRSGDCWVWTGARTPLGYGVIGIGGHDVDYAHRIAWTLGVGSIPTGMCVLHHCDNPPCVNLEHLFVGSKKDNTADMLRKGRHVSPKGEAAGRARLTARQVLELRRLRSDEGLTYRELARRYGVAEPTIGAVVTRRSWAAL